MEINQYICKCVNHINIRHFYDHFYDNNKLNTFRCDIISLTNCYD